MRMTRRDLSLALMAGFAATAKMAPARAATFPDHPIRLIVPYPPGGATDPVARMLAAEVQSQLGQPIVVENRSGAAGSIGTEAVVRAPADGYTLLLHTTAIASEPTLKPNLSYNAGKDLAPLTEAVKGSYLLVANPKLPVKNIEELITYGKANPGKLLYGSAGIGSSGHLIGTMFAQRAGIEAVHVPYRGGGPAVTAVLAGEIHYVFDTVQTSRPLVQEGQLRGLAVTGAERSPMLPSVPTAMESGLPGFDVSYWLGIFAPARTPSPVMQRLASAFRDALSQETVRQRLRDLGLTSVGSTSEEFAATMTKETDEWRAVIQEAGIRLE